MEGFCRGCLIRYEDPMELLHYTEKYRRLFVYSTGLQVKRNDAITFQLCKDCFLNMKAACKFKKLCRSSDKKFKSYLTLKDVGDGIDFCTFLKNNDDTMTFRLPLISGSSTPANQKSREDDNESTCTSIRNFMTDILQGEEMPDTEARIIREVIEEEADVLDDSLDSHWLQDDASIDTDFRLDFSFSPFGTPKSVNHDHFYTPKRLSTNDQEQPKKYFSSISPAGHYNNVNDFTDLIKNNQTEKELCYFNADDGKTDDAVDIEAPISPQNYNNEFNNSEVPHKLIEKSLDSLDLPIITENDKSVENLDLAITNNDKSINNLSTLSIESDQLMNNLDLPSIDSEKSINTLDLPSLPSIENDVSINNLDLPIIDNIKEVENMNECDIPNNNSNYHTTSKEIESLVVSKVNIKKLEKNKSCAIDKNLEKALEDKNNQEFSLDDLLGTPRAYPNASAASTPTITNILFGENLDLNEDKNEITTKLNSKDIGGLLDELLQDDSKNFYEAKENIATKADFVKMDVDEVDTGTVDVKVKTDMLNTETEQCDTKNVSCKRNKMIKSIEASSVDFTTTDVGPLLSSSDTANIDVKAKKVITATAEQFDLQNCVCNICSKKFQSIRALSVHFTKKHNIKIIKPKNAYNRRPKVCNICGKLLRDRQVLFKHLKRCRNKVCLII